jgi:hypothetical protein
MTCRPCEASEIRGCLGAWDAAYVVVDVGTDDEALLSALHTVSDCDDVSRL